MDRIELTSVDRSHASAMFPVLANSSLYEFTGGEPPASLQDVERWFEALETRLSPDGSEQWLTWIVQLCASSTLIGYVQATVRGSKADVAWLIGVNWQGKGYATEALGTLIDWLTDKHILDLTAHIHRQHHASQRVARKLGFANSGVIHEGEEVWVRKSGIQ